ncbi:MAG: methylmalonyl-CoA mutase family protein [Bacteroidota bacterium]
MKEPSSFAAQAKTDWEAKVVKDLKGKPLDGLNWTLEGRTYGALFHADDHPASGSTRPQRQDNQWTNGEWIKVGDISVANQQALAALQKGANAICFEWSHAPNRSEFSRVLEGIHLEWMTLHFAGSLGTQIILEQLLKEYVPLRSYDPARVNAYFLPTGQLKQLPDLVSVFNRYGLRLPKDTTPSQSIAQALDAANRLLQHWQDHDWSLAGHVRGLHFWWQPTDDYFVNIAQVRAFRLLWRQFLSAWQLPIRPLVLTAEVGYYGSDVNSNKIKATSQAMSAVIGGVDQLFIAPSDEPTTSGGSTFTRRLALNIQHLLEQESYLQRVADPAAGSYFIETLTNDLAATAWGHFQQLSRTS